MHPAGSPLLTLKVHEELCAASRAGVPSIECSLDLERSRTVVELAGHRWKWCGREYPFLQVCKERTIYYWAEDRFEPVARYAGSLIKLVPTQWGPPTFEIDGIKMLPTARISPYTDAERKVAFIKPRGKTILDTCGGLGYFAAWCLQGTASQVISYEKNPDVLWLRTLNPWSPQANAALKLTQADVAEGVADLATDSVEAILHDPPRFGTAGELYSQHFYDHLARVLQRNGLLFHYTGTPNKLTSRRDVPHEVASRLRRAGFTAELRADGVLATNRKNL